MTSVADELIVARAERASTRFVDVRLTLGMLVVFSFAVRSLLALQRETPRYFPDELVYSQLARSLAESGRAVMFGESASMPALLEPLATFWTWLPGDPALAFRLTQLTHSALFAIGGIAVYLIARQLGIAPWSAVITAAVALASPDLLYTGYLTADALGYATALFAVLGCIRMLDRPSKRAQLLCLGAIVLASSARLQYVLLLPALVLAVVVVERGRVARAVRRLPFPFVALALGTAAVLGGVIGPGRYGAVWEFELREATPTWLASNSFLLILACGVVIAPGALTGLFAQVFAPTTRVRAAFSSLSLAIVASLVVAAAVMAVETGSARFFERYLMLAIPLCAVGFALWVAEGRPAPRLTSLTSGCFAVAAMVVPVSTFTAGQGRADSPLLLGFGMLEQVLDVGTTSLLISVLSVAGAGFSVWLALARTSHGLLGAAVAGAFLAAVSLAAHAADIELSEQVRHRVSPADVRWVDAAARGRGVVLVHTSAASGVASLTQLFWNTQITRRAVLENAPDPLGGAAGRLTVRRDGVLLLDRRPVTEALLVDLGGARPVFDVGSRVVARARAFALIQPTRVARLRALVDGLGADGWLRSSSTISLYPPTTGCRRISLRLFLPPTAEPRSLRLRSGRVSQVVALSPGGSRRIHLTSGGAQAGELAILALQPQLIAGDVIQAVSARADRIRIEQTPCPVKNFQPLPIRRSP